MASHGLFGAAALESSFFIDENGVVVCLQRASSLSGTAKRHSGRACNGDGASRHRRLNDDETDAADAARRSLSREVAASLADSPRRRSLRPLLPLRVGVAFPLAVDGH